ncbi:MAG: xanthine dehydrogenase family protein subunit M [Thermoleophilia bacterium]|nr:xanthine dehydrogenase family protein subunit M [Thermoleophilia bacterium]
MYLPDFDYYAPGSLEEACGLLRTLGPGAKVLAGGTDLLVKMKHGLVVPEAVVSLKALHELKGITYDPDRGVVIAALATHNDLVDSPVLHKRFLSVSEAAHQMANNQIRNRGTVGGNLVNAIPSADLPPILIALGAQITLVSRASSRTVPLESFFTGPSCCVIDPVDEILTEIVIPNQPTTGSTYIKFGLRRSGALSVAGVAVAVTMAGDVIEDARISMGAVYPVPVRAEDAEKALIGKTWSEALLEEAGEAAACCALPISDIRGSSEYRLDLVRVLTRRALRRAITEGHV